MLKNGNSTVSMYELTNGIKMDILCFDKRQ